MQVLGIVLLVLLVLAGLVLFILKGRTGHPDCRKLDGQLYAHRGFHQEPDAPENSRAAFRRAVQRGYGAEFDVHLLKDGGLAVIHDSDLERVTGAHGEVEDLTTAQLADYTLGQSGESIPTLQEVLEIFAGKVPLVIELKTHGANAPALCATVCSVLDGYKGLYCIESFDPRVLRWLKKRRPDILRGQLSDDFIHDPYGLSPLLAFMETYLAANLFTRPDFIAYKFQDRHNLSNRICRKVWHLAGASWTLRSADELRAAQKEGLWPIFENFDPADA